MALINSVNCDKNFLGTGIGTCEVIINNIMDGVILVPRGWSLPVTDGNVPLTLEAVIQLVQQTTFDPVLNAVDFTDNTGDPTNQDYSRGITTVVRNAKPTYQLTFESGLGFHKAVYSKNGKFNSYDAILVAGGFLVGSISADGGRYTGLTMGMFNARTLSLPAGDTAMRTIVDFQLTDEDQFNNRLAVLTPDALGFNFTGEVLPIESVTLTATASAGDPIQVKVRSIGNTNYGIEALDTANFRVVNLTTGAVNVVTEAVESAVEGNYALTVTTPLVAGDTIRVELYDATVPAAAALVGTNQIYKGESNTITVTA